MPNSLRHPAITEEGETVYQLLTGPGTLFEGAGNEILTASNVPDGWDSTALLFESEQSVPWTKPVDLVYTPGTRVPALRRSSGGYLVAFLNGMVRSIPFDTSDEVLVALITPAGGEAVSIEQFPKNHHVQQLSASVEEFIGRNATSPGSAPASANTVVAETMEIQLEELLGLWVAPGAGDFSRFEASFGEEAQGSMRGVFVGSGGLRSEYEYRIDPEAHVVMLTQENEEVGEARMERTGELRIVFYPLDIDTVFSKATN